MSILINNIYYSLDSNTLTASVADNRNNAYLPTNINIPSTITNNGRTYKVTTINDNAFYTRKSIKSIKLNENLKKVGISAFDQCDITIDILTFPSSLEEIKDYGFAANNIRRVKIHSSLKYIGYCSFGFNLNLESIEVDPKNRFFCNDYQLALYDKKLKRLIQVPTILIAFNVPQSVKFIDKQAFDNMPNLTTLYINGNIKKYHEWSINWCTSLKIIYYFGESAVGAFIRIKETYNIPRIIACNKYKGTFSGIEVEPRDACIRPIKTCNFNNNHHHDLAIFVYVVISIK